MSFWAYMLHCRGGYFYVGHTDDIDRRVGEHQSGLLPGFTAEHQPVELVWSDQFMDREDAKAAERKLKAWSRAKKLALIRGDWELISALAKKKGSASTSSAWTGKGEGEDHPKTQKTVIPELVEGLPFSLQPHPQALPSQVRAVTARVWKSDPNDIIIEFTLEGSEALVLPAWASPARRDGLWQTTCFELFMMCADGRYFEFNLSPSTEWAIYAFDSYRNEMKPVMVDIPPQIEFLTANDTFSLEADIDLGQIPGGQLSLGLSAVIEEEGGHFSYWALAHPPGAPDFHHPACFAATLAASGAA